MSRPERIILWLAMLTMPVAIAILGVLFILLKHESVGAVGHEMYLLTANVAIGFALVSGTLWFIAGLITLYDIEHRETFGRAQKTFHSTMLVLTLGLAMIPWFFNYAHRPRKRQKD